MSPSRPSAIVIVAKDEADNITDCVASARFADEVLVLDSGSSDDTVALAREAGARVVQTDWPGYGPQVARGFGMCQRRWVLSLDADERIRAAAARARSGAPSRRRARRLPGPAPVGVLRALHPPRRLAPRPHAAPRPARPSGFTDHFLHAHMTVEGSHRPARIEPGALQLPRLRDVLEKLDRYSSGHARDMLARGKRGGLGKAVVHGLLAFVRTYILKLGFLDRGHGLMLAIYNAEYTYYKYIKLMFLRSPATRPPLSGAR